MPCSGCSALHEVNPNLKKRELAGLIKIIDLVGKENVQFTLKWR